MLQHCYKLRYTERPDYDYILGLLQEMADERGIDLNDGIFDWSIKAVCIKDHSDFYDFMKNSGKANPFTDRGTFHEHLVPRSKVQQEKKIYEEAAKFQFEDPKQLIKLMQKEHIKQLKRGNYLVKDSDYEIPKAAAPDEYNKEVLDHWKQCEIVFQRRYESDQLKEKSSNQDDRELFKKNVKKELNRMGLDKKYAIIKPEPMDHNQIVEQN